MWFWFSNILLRMFSACIHVLPDTSLSTCGVTSSPDPQPGMVWYDMMWYGLSMLNPLFHPPTIPSSKFSISLVLVVCFVCCNCCRVLLAPIYATIGWLLAWKLQCHRGAIWRCIYVCAVVVSLITAHLFEIRYFTPGVVVFCLNLPKVRQIGCAMSFLLSRRLVFLPVL